MPVPAHLRIWQPDNAEAMLGHESDSLSVVFQGEVSRLEAHFEGPFAVANVCWKKSSHLLIGGYRVVFAVSALKELCTIAPAAKAQRPLPTVSDILKGRSPIGLAR